MSDLILIPKVKISPRCLCIFHEVHRSGRALCYRRDRVRIPISNDNAGLISNRSSRKIKNAIDWLLFIAQDKEVFSSWHGKFFKFRINFVTLTLASKQIHSDNEIKSLLLNQLLVEARQRWGVNKYLWRAEAQRNGNIHFHIVTDKFIPWSELRDTWNRIQNKLGYVDRYRDEMKAFHAGGFRVRKDLLEKWSFKNQLAAYRQGSKKDWNSPNSTDVHSIVKVRNISAYLAKYCTKNSDYRPIEGRNWGLSENLSQVNNSAIEIDTAISDELEQIATADFCEIFNDEFFSLFFADADKWMKLVPGRLASILTRFVDDFRSKYP